jgi:hypothetical protein
MTGARSGAEEAGIGRVLREEGCWKLGPDLVGFAPDAGADGGEDARAPRALALRETTMLPRRRFILMTRTRTSWSL